MPNEKHSSSVSNEVIKIELSKKQFDALRKNEKFILILQLARYANQINYIWGVPPARTDSDVEPDLNPAGNREIFNRLLFTSGIMYEMLKMVPALAREFRHFPSYQSGFGKLWKDKNTHKLREGLLKKMRNRVAYHVDVDPIRETLETIDYLPNYIFVREVVNDPRSTHFQLADDIAFNFVTGQHETDVEQQDMFVTAVSDLATLVGGFNKSTHALIQEYAQRKDWYASEVVANAS